VLGARALELSGGVVRAPLVRMPSALKADRARGNSVGDFFHILWDLGGQLFLKPHKDWPKPPKPEENLSLPLLDANEDRDQPNIRIDFVLVFKRPDKDEPDKDEKNLKAFKESMQKLQPKDSSKEEIATKRREATLGGKTKDLSLNKAVLAAICESALSTEAKVVARQFTDEVLNKRWVEEVSPSEVRTALIELFCNMFSGRHGETATYPTLFESVDGDELFVCVQMDRSVVLKYAEFSGHKVQLDKEEVIKHLQIPYLPSTHSPAHVPYRASIDHLCQKWYPGGGTAADISVLRNVDVILLGLRLIERHFNLNIWKEMGVLSAFFPAHNWQKIQHMKYKLAHFSKLKYQKKFIEMRVEGETERAELLAKIRDKGENIAPGQAEEERKKAGKHLRDHLHDNKNVELLLEIRDYFGEKIAFYFGFLFHTTRYLQVLSFLAIVLHVFEFFYLTDTENKSASGRFWDIVSGRIMAHWARLTFGVVLSIWLAIFVGNWKHHQAHLANRWGTEVGEIAKNDLKKHVVIKTDKKVDKKMQGYDVDKSIKRNDTLSEKFAVDELETKSMSLVKKFDKGKKAEDDAKKQRQLKIKGTMYSWLMTTLYALTSFIVTCCILRHRGYLKTILHTDPDSGKPWFGIVTPLGLTSFLLTFQMQFFTRTMPWVSARLTNWEMHKIERDYVASNAIKVMIVNFLASFSAFFYVAFVQQFIEGCKKIDDDVHVPDHDVSGRYTDQCMQQLVRDMQTVFMTYILLSLLDVLVPFFKVKLKLAVELREKRKQSEKSQSRKSPTADQHRMSVSNDGEARPDDTIKYSFLESQAKLDEYTGGKLAGDYQQIMFPLIFVSLFGMAFPLSAAFTLILIWIQEHLDAFKLTTTYRRPPPEAASGIGTWRMQFLSYLCYMSACVNVGLSVFRLFQGATDDIHGGFVFRYDFFRNLAPTSSTPPTIEDDEKLKQYGIMVQVLVLLAAQQLLLIVVISVKSFCSRDSAELVVERERQEKQQRRLFSEMGGKHNIGGSHGALFMADLQKAEKLPWNSKPDDYFQGIKTLRLRCPQYYEPAIVEV